VKDANCEGGLTTLLTGTRKRTKPRTLASKCYTNKRKEQVVQGTPEVILGTIKERRKKFLSLRHINRSDQKKKDLRAKEKRGGTESKDGQES